MMPNLNGTPASLGALLQFLLILSRLLFSFSQANTSLKEPCPSGNLIGHINVSSYLSDAEENGATEFVLCPGVVYNEPLISPYASLTAIQCADPNDICEWDVDGGDSHLVIDSPGMAVILIGIVFSGATDSSISISSNDGELLSVVQFVSCAWMNNTGRTVIEAIDNSTSSKEVDPGTRRWLQNDRPVQVQLQDCYFEENNVTESIVYTNIANTTLHSCDFQQNRAGASVIRFDFGHHLLDDVSLEHNEFENLGVVSVSAEARLEVTKLCGSDNRAAGICNATFFEVVDPDNCISPTNVGCAPGCLDFEPCGATCISSLDALQLAIEKGGTVELCSGVTIDLSDLLEPMEIRQSPISISCIEGNCTLSGGNEQFRIVDGANDVIFDGIAFENSQALSIHVQIDPTEPSSIAFRNCHWRNHEGDSVILIVSPETSRRELQGDEPIEASITISDSHFEGNNGNGILIENSALLLDIKASHFQDNAYAAIVGALAGETSVKDSVMGNNQVNSGLFHVGLDSRGFLTERTCADSTSHTGSCNGTFYEAADPATCREDSNNIQACQENCVQVESCSPDSGECSSTYGDLAQAIQANGGGEYVICVGTTMQLLGNTYEVIEISEPGTVVKCGLQGSSLGDCVLAGGAQHFILSTTSVSFQGITFSGATGTAVHVIADLVQESSIIFDDCVWEMNLGENALVIQANGDDSGVTQYPAKVIISKSSFLNNTVSASLVSNSASMLTISETSFLGNVVQQSLVDLQAGRTEMTNDAFVENSINNGLVFVSVSSALSYTQLCGDDNIGGNIPCNGIFFETVDSQGCFSGDTSACDAGCLALDSCTENSTFCFSEWSQLIDDAKNASEGSSFVICPATTFALTEDDAPLVIDKTGTTLTCGTEGIHDDQCVIFGGQIQVMIKGTASGIMIKGLTFLRSSNISIAAFGENVATATLNDCEFSGHEGETVISLSDYQGDTRRLLVDGLPQRPSKSAMQLTIQSCLFDDNFVHLAPIVNLRGALTVESSSFNGNNGNQTAGAIVALYDSSLSVSDSCFTDNIGNISGAIMLVHDESQVFNHDGNYGDGNKASQGNCTGIVTFDGGDESCDLFDAAECAITLGTAEPSSTPGPPNGTNSDAPSSSPLPSSRLCYDADSWADLFEAVRNSSGDEVFQLCAETIIDMAEMEIQGLSPLLIQASGITFQCESPKKGACILMGGSTHIQISNSVQRTLIKDVSMQHASNVSVVGTQSIPYFVEFQSCRWVNNTGFATVAIAKVNETRYRDRVLQTTNDNYLTFSKCTFQNNSASDTIISGQDVTFIIQDVLFEGNSFANGLISIDSTSYLLLEDSCITDSTTAAPLIESSSVQVFTKNLYHSQNGEASCNGYIDSNGDCVEAANSTSCKAAEIQCYADWDDLAEGVGQLLPEDEGRVFTVCEDTALELTSASLPITLGVSRTNIRCGVGGTRGGNCTVTGGFVHFQITGGPIDVILSGITFTNAKIASVVASGARSARAQISDCAFRNMEGSLASLLIYDGAIPSPSGNTWVIEDFIPPADRSMTVEVSFCSFESVNAIFAPIASLKGTIVVSSCEFTGNSGAGGGMAEWYGGSMSLSNSCFSSNVGQFAGSVFIDGDSISIDENNFQDSNDATNNSCAGVFLSQYVESDGAPPGVCRDFDAASCLAEAAPSPAPTVSPTLPPRESGGEIDDGECIDSWDKLSAAIGSSNDTEATVFTLCTEQAINVTDDAIVVRKNLFLECGPNGRLRNNCLLSGGIRHFKLLGEGIDVSFRGITFEGSSDVSVLAAADRESNARFEECQWTGNAGQTVVLVYNEAAGQEYARDTAIDSLPLTGTSMSVSFQDCIFKSNPATHSIVSNIGGKTTFSFTAFENNGETFMASIVARNYADLDITSSCFIQNDSNLSGTVFLSTASRIQFEDNYGYDNRVGFPFRCTDIFTLAEDENCSTTSCPGLCSTFDAKRCRISGYEFDAPSSAPSEFIPVKPTIPGQPNEDSLYLEKTSLLTSGFIAQNLLIAAIICVSGFVSFFYCKSKQGRRSVPLKNESSPAMMAESAPLRSPEVIERFEDDEMMNAGPVVLDPNSRKKENTKQKGKLGGFFGQRNNNAVVRQEEFEPIVHTHDAWPVQRSDGLQDDDEDEFHDEIDDEEYADGSDKGDHSDSGNEIELT